MSVTTIPTEPDGDDADAAERAASPVYTTAGMSNEFRQSEIITRVAQYDYRPETNRAAELYRDYIIIITQDCDLLWDYKAAQDGKPSELNEVLVYEAEDATIAKSRVKGDIWRRIANNKDDRYHFLERIPKELDVYGEGLPPLVIDFKRYFSIPEAELRRQCASLHGAKRRTRLAPPYREHLQNRVTFYLQRVGLPVDHIKKL